VPPSAGSATPSRRCRIYFEGFVKRKRMGFDLTGTPWFASRAKIRLRRWRVIAQKMIHSCDAEPRSRMPIDQMGIFPTACASVSSSYLASQIRAGNLILFSILRPSGNRFNRTSGHEALRP
jgi:hypothetical protein